MMSSSTIQRSKIVRAAALLSGPSRPFQRTKSGIRFRLQDSTCDKVEYFPQFHIISIRYQPLVRSILESKMIFSEWEIFSFREQFLYLTSSPTCACPLVRFQSLFKFMLNYSLWALASLIPSKVPFVENIRCDIIIVYHYVVARPFALFGLFQESNALWPLQKGSLIRRARTNLCMCVWIYI
jgi:hypothetical protein